MPFTLGRLMQMLKQNSGGTLFNPEFFEMRRSGTLGTDILTVKPIIRFPEGKVRLEFNVGTRGHGTDRPKWPENLMTEIVA